MNKLVILFFVVLAIVGSIDAWTKIPIEHIKDLHLYRGRYTTGVKPVLQQDCVEDGARLCSYYAPDHIHCTNIGSSRGAVQWRCEARLANGVSLGRLNVECEIYPGTPAYQGYVIDGSCGLRYTLRRS